MLFSEIPGLESLKNTLISAVKRDHLAHAQMFFGKEGSANLSLALALATYLNCDNPGETDACGACPSCQKMAKHIHPDVHYVFPISATEKIKGDDVISSKFYSVWRSFLLDNLYANMFDWGVFFGGENKQMQIPRRESREIIKNLSLKAFEGKYKIMLIWLPEHMHSSAANAILKILEEPPEKTVFMLVTEDLEQIISTILSRTQIVKVPNFNDKELSTLLTEKFGLEQEKVERLLPLAEGNARLALKLSSEVADDAQQLFIEWMRLCFSRDATNLIGWAEKFQKLSKAEQRGMLSYGMTLLRESLLIGATANSLVKTQGAGESFAAKFNQSMGMDKTAAIIDFLNTAIYHLERNANAKIMFLDLSFQIATVLKK